MRRVWLVSALLAACTAAVYLQVGWFDFVSYDDPFFVTANRQVLAGLTADSVAWAFTSIEAFWIPLTWLSHMLDVQVFGLWPGGHHLSNLAWHVAGVVLLFWAWYRMTGDLWPSALVAALFALHPLHAESVSWVSERKGVLSSCLWIATLWAYAGYARRPGILNYLLVSVALALGLLAKPTLVTLPCVMLLLDFWPLGRLRLGSSEPNQNWPAPCAPLRWRWLLLEKLPWLLMVVAASAIAVRAEDETGALDWLPGLTWQSRVYNACIVVWLYLGKLVFPAGLTFFYPHPGNAVSVSGAAAACLAIVAVTVVAVRHMRARPYLLTGWLWYLGTLVPSIGLIQVGGHRMADRYTDIPAIGIYTLVAWGLANVCRLSPQSRSSVTFAAVLVLAMFAGISARQATFWRNSDTLYRHALEVDPNNWVALTNYARLLEEQRKFVESRQLYQRAVQANPDNSAAANGLGSAFIRENRLPEAIEFLEKVIERHPEYALAHSNLAIAYGQQGRTADADRQFVESLRWGGNLAPIHRNYGVFLGTHGRVDEAVAQFREAARLAIDPQNDAFNAALTLLNANRHAEALGEFSQIIERWPQLVEARLGRARAALAVGRGADAVLDFQHVLTVKPDDQLALLGLSWIQATSPDPLLRNGVSAVKHAEKVCQATNFRSARALDALAAANAEAGRFQQVEEIARRAKEFAEHERDPALAAAIGERLKVYRQKQPFRDSSGTLP